ncbi:bifunctional 4-hydroxy-2-oxoglutarate aldolase/2-dehydro-3-deoxy-phosphogluconate aldolase [Quadrisphaera oryzae]|uniref:bifunctional 4-hydroxy-2-oxoglutarate aldolase/2-dehydro-3-deoxy-phosphogluconate aldolase n=1 Tax=Quadrisphaera TaxID=317661 RepID=UPI001646E893|nr:bifunctional 4-hydroxy-2-oxoglutarate aldolase/2-dehydro-3-deoxy-phosphogluconate aldolase [Quadrisphaera sp. RL12-1S]MBC3761517.1 bifunctional 4-hydroxy-2-oxoglutarate aldolase/2-dehydro-3-deoxy-phosphogluconate aldolase [Quadrisphaera sp. RL12-1S]
MTEHTTEQTTAPAGPAPGTEDLLSALARCPLLPVVVVGERTDGAALGAALAEGGLTAAEVVLRTPAALRVLAEMAPTAGLVVGAGTVVDPDQVDAVVDAGAAFVVSPGHDPDVVARARSRGVPAVPGVSTASEVQLARRSGLRLLKLFPAGAVGGTALLSGLAGPFPDVAFVPTGGIGEAELGAYLALRSVAGVGGSWCVPAALVADVTGRGVPAWDDLVEGVAAAVAACRAARP